MTRPLGALNREGPELDKLLVGEMATLLREQGTDLTNERAVIAALTAGRFRSGDVVALMDRAIAATRENADA